jgi:hypothetical protein
MHGYGVGQLGRHTHFLECNIHQNKVKESPNYASKPSCPNVSTKRLQTWNLSYLHNDVQVEWKPSVVNHGCLSLMEVGLKAQNAF